MRVLLQRVSSATVTVDQQEIGRIGRGYVIFLGVVRGDSQQEAEWLTNKILNLRLFEGADGKINDRSILDIKGDILLVSQFTLAAVVTKGNRPDYTLAEGPARAEELYVFFRQQCAHLGAAKVETGQFGAHMEVQLINDGPVTLCIDRPPPASL